MGHLTVITFPKEEPNIFYLWKSFQHLLTLSSPNAVIAFHMGESSAQVFNSLLFLSQIAFQLCSDIFLQFQMPKQNVIWWKTCERERSAKSPIAAGDGSSDQTANSADSAKTSSHICFLEPTNFCFIFCASKSRRKKRTSAKNCPSFASHYVQTRMLLLYKWLNKRWKKLCTRCVVYRNPYRNGK